MVKIYTKTGDKGKTSLLNGTRVSKDHHLIEAYGLLDELNSYLGLVAMKLADFSDTQQFIIKIQKNIFLMSSFISCPKEDREKYNIKNIVSNDINTLEREIDKLDSSLDKLKNFIIPGGTEAACLVHLCRTKCRTIERFIIRDNDLESIQYLNRLSDYLFTLSRYINNKKNKNETIWP